MIAPQKHLFDLPKEVAYFNNAYMSPLMEDVVRAMEKGMALKQRPWIYTSDQFFTFCENARALAGRIFGGPADNIAIIPSVSYGVQIAANNLPLPTGKTVLALEDQFPSHIYPWQEKCRRANTEFKLLSAPQNQDWTSVLLENIGSDTAIVAIPQTHWASGATIDLVKIRSALDQVGGYLVLDLTQSLGAQPFNASEVRPDFAVCATYKWLMGPYSLGFVYIDPRWHDGVPLEYNWINREGSEDFKGLTHYRDGFQPGARRFDMGEKSNPGQLGGASAALSQLLDWGVDNIAETLGAKTDRIETALAEFGFSAPRRDLRADHYLGLFHPDVDLGALMAHLVRDNIYVSARGPNLRITPHLYCDDEDEARLIDGIRNYLEVSAS